MADMIETPFGNVPSFIFGGNTGVMSPKELEARRMAQIARANRAQRAFPTTLGAGIASLGEAVGENMADRRLRAAEQAEMDRGKAGLADPRFQMPGTGPSAALDPRTAVTAALAGPPPNPTLAAGDTTSPQELPQAAGGLPAEYAAAIAGIESSGGRDPYGVLGAVTPKGDRAFGKYQIMGANIPDWTQAALGQRLTPQQFLASKEVQDRVFQHRFGEYVNKYGPEGAARAWYAGEKGMNNLGATDQHGRLTVQGYGQDFMRRLPGTRTAAGPEGALPPDVGRGESVDDNPPTPTAIKPMRVAGPAVPADVGPLAAPEGVPGPRAPVAPLPAAPSFGKPAASATTPRELPPAPQMDTRLNPYEIRGHQLKALSRGNAEMDERAKTLIDYGASVRKSEYDRRVEEWKSQVEWRKADELAKAAYERERPLKEAELSKRELELQQAKQEADRKNRLGGIPEATYVKAIEESHKNAQNIPAAVKAIDNTIAAIDGNKLFTGKGAEIALQTAKAKTIIGIPADPRIAPTETFKSEVKAIVAGARQQLAGNANVSDRDMQAAEDMAAGNITLEPGTIKRVLSLIRETQEQNAIAHQKRLLTYTGDDERAQQKVYGLFSVPDMERIVTKADIDILRKAVKENDAAAFREFDDAYATPGLARRVLQREITRGK